jgi:hypothetical protein
MDLFLPTSIKIWQWTRDFVSNLQYYISIGAKNISSKISIETEAYTLRPK